MFSSVIKEGGRKGGRKGRREREIERERETERERERERERGERLRFFKLLGSCPIATVTWSM